MAAAFYGALPQAEVERIHRAALRVLAEVGVQIESPELLSLLAAHGARVDLGAQRARYPAALVEQFVAGVPKHDWASHQPTFGCSTGIYQSAYLNPETERLEAFTENSLRDYIRLANALPEVAGVGLLGLPFVPADTPAAYAPLTEKLYAWKHGASPSGTVQFTSLCPYLVELYARRAEELGRPLSEVWGATGYLVSPLRLARPECEQLLYFHSRGLRMGIGHMLSLGATTPVTVAGAAVLALAEILFLSLLRLALWGENRLHVGGFGVVMDMRTGRSMGGRPESTAVTAVLGQVARFYGVASGGGGGLSDAKSPSVQAGMQKALASVAVALSCGGAWLDAGLLSLDEICSPEQLLYDTELVAALRRLLHPIEVTEETCAVEDIAAVGPGGHFLGSELTARRFREEVWEPLLWDRDSLHGWLASGQQTERARVKERIRALLSAPPPPPGLTPECERDLRAIITRAIAAA